MRDLLCAAVQNGRIGWCAEAGSVGVGDGEATMLVEGVWGRLDFWPTGDHIGAQPVVKLLFVVLFFLNS